MAAIALILLGVVVTCEGLSIDQLFRQIHNKTEEKHGFDVRGDPSSSVVQVQFDMMFTLDDWRNLTVKSTRRRKRKAWRDTIRRWPGKEIPYIVEDLTSTHIDELNKAINEWQKNTCIRFRAATQSDTTRRLKIMNGPGCASWVGMQAIQPQELYLHVGCRHQHIISHELGHAIGFIHEQSRPDRAKFVDIQLDNAVPGREVNFKRFPIGKINTFNIPYDYRSLMHYGGKFYSLNGGITIKTKDSSMQSVIGEAKILSFRDIKAANLMYSCNEHCPKELICTDDPEGYIGPDCKCWNPGSLVTGSPVSISEPMNATACKKNYAIYLPLDEDFTDKSCHQIEACAIGTPEFRSVGLSFDGQSYLELPSFNTKDGTDVKQMTILVRFKVTTAPQDFAAVLSNGEIDTAPTVDVHINNENKIVAGINGVYFTPQQTATGWTSVKIVFDSSKMKLFINDRKMQTMDTNGDTVQNTELPLRIGGGSNGFDDGYLNGYIDKVEISEQALSS